MCEHHHEHGCGHNHENQKQKLIRIIVALIIFAVGFVFHADGILRFFLFAFAYLLAGGDVLYTALKNILKGEVFDENFLMSVATIGAFAIKEYPEAVMVMILYQIGEYFQHKAVEKSRKSIKQLMDIRPDYANVEKDGKLVKVNPIEVKKCDIIAVKTGEKIPLDGTVIEGEALVDTSALTGESVPISVRPQDSVLSGCINTNGFLKISVSKEFGESTVSKILELVEHAASKKAKTENFITKFARYYTPIVVLGAVLLAILPPLVIDGAQFSTWLSRALTFLVISCPCALVISVPLSFFAGIGGASKCGILIKGSSYLEILSNVETVVFDKTGTLTKGVFDVSKILPAENVQGDEVLYYSAMAEAYSSHPIAVALRKAYKKDFDYSSVSNIKEIAGNGVQAFVNGVEILVGNASLLEKFNVEFSKLAESGTIVYVAKDKQYLGCIVISDEIKPDAAKTIQELKKTVNNISSVYSELLPAQKVEKTEDLIAKKEQNKSVVFVGDGINDAPVLTLSDVGIAMGALGSDAAIEAADIVIMDDKPSKVAISIKIAQKTMGIVRQNIVFAIGIKFAILNALRALHTDNFIKE